MTMTAPGIVILLLGLLVLGSGIIGYINTASIPSLVGGSASGFGLLASGLGALKRKQFWFVFAPFITLLLTALFACHLVVTGDLLPSSLMVILGLVALALFYRSLPSKETL